MKTDHSILICGVLSAINAVKPHSCQFTQETIKKASKHLASTQAGPYTKAMEALNLIYGSRNVQHSEAWKAGVELAGEVLSGTYGVKLCAVPDCSEQAQTERQIAINGAPKEMLPVCSMHADAADEDMCEENRFRTVWRLKQEYDGQTLGSQVWAAMYDLNDDAKRRILAEYEKLGHVLSGTLASTAKMLNMKPLCAVCDEVALTKRKIRINGYGPEVEPVCEVHADMADKGQENFKP
jgi:hypothetical protein